MVVTGKVAVVSKVVSAVGGGGNGGSIGNSGGDDDEMSLRDIIGAGLRCYVAMYLSAGWARGQRGGWEMADCG